MKDKQYMISGKLLKELEEHIKVLMENDYSCSDCYALEIVEELKSKKPIEPLNRDKVEKITDDYVITARRNTGLPTRVHKDLMIDQILSLTPQPIEPSKDNLFPEARSMTPEERKAEKEWKKKKFKTIGLDSKDNIDIVIKELSKQITSDSTGRPFGTVSLQIRDIRQFAHNLLSKLNIEYATPDKIRKIINSYVLPDETEECAKDISNLIVPSGEVIAEGIVCLTTEGYEGSCTGVYLDTGETKIGLSEFLTESEAVEFEGTKVKLKIHKCKESK